MTDRELMQQALDALEKHVLEYETAEALRVRLAQPEQEPVAWFMEGTFEDGTPSFIQVCETDPEFYTPLYTAPPQREWQGLTEMEKIEIQMLKWWDWEDTFDLDGYTRAIEAKLKEKNK